MGACCPGQQSSTWETLAAVGHCTVTQLLWNSHGKWSLGGFGKELLHRGGQAPGRQSLLALKENQAVRPEAPASNSILLAWYGDPTQRWAIGKGAGLLCTEKVVDQLRAS